MRFMIIGKATAESEKQGALPDPQLMDEMGKYNEELMKAGILLASDGLLPSSPRACPSGTSASPASRSGR